VRVYLESLGCRLNAAEIEQLARQFAGAGHEVVENPAHADVIALNACAVTAQAVRKSRHRVRALHRDSPGAAIAVLGCWATSDAERIARIEGVRWVMPNRRKTAAVAEIAGSVQEPAPWAPGRWGHTRAFLGVQDGCDHVCTYCVTRLLRGPARSRPLPEVLAEVQDLVAHGAQEVVLTGVSLGSYGQDLGLERGLPALVGAILSKTRLPRLRLSSVEPWDVTKELLAFWVEPRLCRQLHVPLQSGSNAVLKRMARPISVEAFGALVSAARAVSPDLAITTDLIAGFPGESEDDFERTRTFVSEMAFARLHVFPYSERAGTAAARLSGPVPRAVRQARAAELRRLGATLAATFRERFVGRIEDVLWEGQDGGGTWTGLTDTYLQVRTADTSALYNRITPTRLVATDEGALMGQVLNIPVAPAEG